MLPFKAFNISKLAETIHHYTLSRESGSLENLASTSLLWNENKHDSIDFSHAPKKQSNQSLIRRLSSHDFLKYLKAEEPFHVQTPMLVLFTASFCGFCGVAVAHYVALSRFLNENYGNHLNITLAKIDVFKNSLPMDMTPENIPAFVFFPAEK